MGRSNWTWLIAGLACALCVCRAPGIAHADLISSSPGSRLADPVSAAPEPGGTQAPRAHDLVGTRLAAVGLTGADAQARLAELSPADLEVLAASPDQVQVAGISLEEDPLLFFLIGAAVIIGTLLLVYFLNDDDDDDDPVVDDRMT